MRLFITQATKNTDTLVVDEQRVLHHARVLRLKEKEKILIQEFSEEKVVRYMCEVISYTKTKLTLNILEQETKDCINQWPSMIICTPNSSDKLHIIVQKLSEIWIHEIIFYHSDRSQGMKVNDKKLEKLQKISLEAVEQSNGWMLPKVSVIHDFEQWLKNKNLVMFDATWGQTIWDNILPNSCGIVWPEWGFSENEFEVLKWFSTQSISLWNTILRTETAAIIWWWILTCNT